MSETDSTQSSGPLAAYDIDGLKVILINAAVQFLVHGIYTAMTTVALYALCTRRLRLAARRILISATIIMFLCSTASVIESLASTLVQLPELGLDAAENIPIILTNLAISTDCLIRINYLISDAIVVWRAWVLWSDKWQVHVLLSLCWIGSFVGASIDFAFSTRFFLGDDRFIPLGPRTLLLTLPLLLTNVVSTSLIAYKAWQYRRQIKSNLNLADNKRTKLEKILMLLTESGIIYCLIWVMNVFLGANELDETTFAYNIITSIVPEITATYPVLIILLVALEKTNLEATLTTPSFSQDIRFASTSHVASQRNSTGVTYSTIEISSVRRDSEVEEGLHRAEKLLSESGKTTTIHFE
ncbi:hypothetical protein C8J56DRAFT_922369 [Mycena floridula]|nr:hypothetical protein C8J56DRAFT_922369 [Mycena floridula]